MTLNDWISSLLYFIRERALSTIAIVDVDNVKGQFALHIYVIWKNFSFVHDVLVYHYALIQN